MAYVSRLKDAMIDDLFRAVLSVEGQEECYRFFEDLCTVGELRAMSQRWRVAKMLTEDRTYADIIKETGVSTATISRVKKCLHYGADGYRIILGRYYADAGACGGGAAGAGEGAGAGESAGAGEGAGAGEDAGVD